MSNIINFINQIMLYSGQFALFYLFMQFGRDSFAFIFDTGHLVLLIALVVQTIALVLSKKPSFRFIFSFISPFAYTIVEINLENSLDWFFNTGHFFFWIYSFVIAVLQYNNDTTKNQIIKIYTEFLITFIGVSIFVFIYFVADRLDESSSFEISNLISDLSSFIHEPTHIYITIAGFFLSLSIAISRVKIVQLNEKVSTLLERYVDKKIKDKLLNQDSHSSTKSELVIIFSDIRGFTKLSEEREPQEVIDILNIFFSTWNKIVTKRDGLISKFIGDEVMILFGLDTPIDRAIDNAVISTFEFNEQINQNLKIANLPQIDFGIGINAGNVMIGNIGGDNRYDYTVIGDNVNVASRVQALCKEHKKRIIITKSVFERLSSNLKMKFRFLKEESIRGKSIKLEIFST